jgi:hypothetical protein
MTVIKEDVPWINAMTLEDKVRKCIEEKKDEALIFSLLTLLKDERKQFYRDLYKQLKNKEKADEKN